MSRTQLKWLLSLGLILATVGLFGRMVWDRHDFVNYDDHLYVTRNLEVQAGLSFWGVLKTFHLSSNVAANWHPLTMITHMADCSMYGMQGWGHHLNNLVLHTFDVVLLFLVFSRMTGRIWPSALVAALFSWHPLHVESVAWVSERKDVLSAMFWLLSMWAYARYVEKPGIGKYLGVAALMVLGLLSKPMVVTLPCVLLLMDLWPLNRLGEGDLFSEQGLRVAFQKLPWLLLEKLPLFALVVLESIMTFFAQQNQDAVAGLDMMPILVRVINSLMSYSAYISNTIWPVDLSIPYPLDTRDMTVLQALLAFIGAGLITTVAAMLYRFAPYLLVGWLWYLGTLVPVIGFVQVGSAYMADRYTYIPLIGIFAALAFGLADLVDRRPRIPAWAFVPLWLVATALPAMALLTEYGRRNDAPVPVAVILTTIGCLALVATGLGLLAARSPRMARVGVGAGASLALALFGVLTFWQVGYWKDTTHLFSHTIKGTIRNHGAYFALGTAYWREFDFEKTLEMYDTSLKIGPNLSMPRYNRAMVYRAQKKDDLAIRDLEAALRMGHTEWDCRLEIGRIHLSHRDWEKARQQFVRVLELNPRSAHAESLLGAALIQLDQPHEGIKHYLRAVTLAPNDARPAVLLSRILSSHPDAKYRNPDEALRLAEVAARVTEGRNAVALDTLALAYAAKKDYQAAREYAGRAKGRAYFDKEDEFAAEVERRYERFLADRPYYEDPKTFDPLRN